MIFSRSMVVLVWGLLAVTDTMAATSEPLQLSSSSFEDGGQLSTKYAGKNPSNRSCVGDNISPALSWSGAPAGTKSFALLMADPEGRNGLGVNHLVAYGISAATTAFPEGALSGNVGFVGGKGTNGNESYFGPCPPVGAGVHHYTFTLIATDLEPDALPGGLSRELLLEKLDGHSLAAAAIIGRFGHP